MSVGIQDCDRFTKFGSFSSAEVGIAKTPARLHIMLNTQKRREEGDVGGKKKRKGYIIIKVLQNHLSYNKKFLLYSKFPEPIY